MSYSTFSTNSESNFSLLKLIKAVIPSLEWLPKYEWDNWLWSDLVAGTVLVAILIPQNMAYAMLAGLPPYYGLYTCLTPPLVYAFLASGSYTAVGTFSLIAIMIKQASDNICVSLGIPLPTAIPSSEYMTIVFNLTFLVGLLQVIFGIFKLGAWFKQAFLPAPAVKGFITASSMFIMTTQLKPALGIEIPKMDTYFDIILKWVYALFHINEVHWPTILLVVSCLIGSKIIGLINEYIEKRYQNSQEAVNLGLISGQTRKSFQLPDILLIMIASTFIVGYFRFDILFNLSIVGEIPSGLPSFTPLNFTYLYTPSKFVYFLTPALLISLTCYIITISTTKAYLNQGLVPFNEDQELIAIGLSSMVGSQFSSYVNCGSLTRTAVLVRAGAKSQISQLVATLLLALTLLYLTPLFYFLPKATLASIIVLACKNLLKDLFALPRRIRAQWNSRYSALDQPDETRLDFIIWMIMFISILTFSLQKGLVIGIFIVALVRLLGLYLPNTFDRI